MLELYQTEDCPECRGVRAKMTELGLSYVIHNPRSASGETYNAQSYDELLALGGRNRLPFLVDHLGERTLYGDDAIVSYVDGRYGDGPAENVEGNGDLPPSNGRCTTRC